jgi:hypothetical protein
MVSLGPPTGWTPAATPGAAAEAAAPPPGQTPAASEWRSEGSVLLGLDLVRSVFDATGAPTAQVKAKVIGWLPASASDYVDSSGKPAALYRICYLDGSVRGDVEDLVEDEVRGSVPVESRAALAEREQILLEENGGAPPPEVMLPTADDDEEEEEDEDEEDEDEDLLRRLQAEEDEAPRSSIRLPRPPQSRTPRIRRRPERRSSDGSQKKRVTSSTAKASPRPSIGSATCPETSPATSRTWKSTRSARACATRTASSSRRRSR